MTKIPLETYNDQNILETSKMTNITKNVQNDQNNPETQKMNRIPLESLK